MPKRPLPKADFIKRCGMLLSEAAQLLYRHIWQQRTKYFLAR